MFRLPLIGSLTVIGLCVYGIYNGNVHPTMGIASLTPNASITDKQVSVDYTFRTLDGDQLFNTERLRFANDQRAYTFYNVLNDSTRTLMDVYYRIDDPTVNSLRLGNVQTTIDQIIFVGNILGILVGIVTFVYFISLIEKKWMRCSTQM